MNASEQKIVKMTQEMLLEKLGIAAICMASIPEHIDQMVNLYRLKQPDWGKDIDCSAVIDELVAIPVNG